MSTRTITIGYKDDNSDIGTMSVKITGKNLWDSVTLSETFILTKIKSCKYAGLIAPTVTQSTIEYTIGASSTEYLL